MELISVMVIIGFIAVFAIPNYQRMVEKSHERDAVTNLRIIAAAQEAYFTEYGAYWPSVAGWQTVGAINSNLRINIIENQIQYSCAFFIGITWCFADRVGGPVWRVQINSNNWQPICGGGACPTCDGGGCP